MKRQREVSIKARGRTGDSEEAWGSTTSLKFTGALAGTRLMGCRPRSKDAVIVLDADVRPLKSCVEHVRKSGEMNLLVSRCLQVFPGWDRARVALWLANAVDDAGETFLDANLGVTVLELGKGQLKAVPQCVGKKMSVADLENEFPRPSKTKPGKRHTLVMHLGGWSAWTMQRAQTQAPCATYLDLDTMAFVTDPAGKRWVNVDGFGICYAQHARPVLQLDGDFGGVTKLLQRMTSGELKSLMQKLLRKSPSKVQLGDEVYDAARVLEQLIEVALAHKGGFVPQIQTHVGGLVSLFKRLAVSMVEDAWLSEESVHALLCAACVAQLDPDFYPSPQFVFKVKQWGVDAMRGTSVVAWNMKRGAAYAASTVRASTPLARSAAMLRFLKSFVWDLHMFEDVANMRPLVFHTRKVLAETSMACEVYLDHHVDPSVVYYAGPRAVQIANRMYDKTESFGDMEVSDSTIFAAFSRAIFHQVSGTNPRRPVTHARDPEFIALVERAQTELLVEMHGAHILGLTNRAPALPRGEPETLQFEFSPSCLAAAIGHMQVRVDAKPYFAFISKIHEDLTTEWSAVRVPTRHETNTTIDEAARLRACALGKAVLAKTGARVNSIWFPDQQIAFEGGKLFLVRTVCECVDGRMRKARVLEQPSFCKTFTTNLGCVAQLLRELPIDAARRLLRLTEGYVTKCVFPKLTRDGGSEDVPSHRVDPELFARLRGMAPLFELRNVREFAITEPLTWYFMRENVLAPYCKAHVGETRGWRFKEDGDQRTLTAAQCRALRKLQKCKTDASLVVMDTGSGKTLVLMKYLIWLASKGKLPDTVLVTTPASAMHNVEREVDLFCETHVRDMRAGKRSTAPLREFCVSLISHDHLRLVRGIWDDCLPRCMLVVDEFHECMENTLRTKYAQEFASAALRRVGLSATPVLNNDIYQLTGMLKPLCAFEPTASNFFVAYSEVVQEYEPMPFTISNETHHHEMTNDDYFALLPVNLGGRNPRKLQPDDLTTLMNLAMHESSRHMVELTLKCVAQGRTVFLVGKHADHVREMAAMLCKTLSARDVFVAARAEDVITLTDKTVDAPADERFRRYKVVIVPFRVAAGYSVTICDTMISSVDFSNAAVREQLRGRIKRLCSSHKQLFYHTVACGVVHSLVLKRYSRSDSFAAVLRDINS